MAHSDTIEFRSSSNNTKANDTPLLSISAKVVTPSYGKQFFPKKDVFLKDFPIVISSRDDSIARNNGSCLYISTPDTCLAPNHAKITIDDIEGIDLKRLCLEHSAQDYGNQEPCTKIFYKDFITGRYTLKDSVSLTSNNPKTLISAPDFKIVSGLVEIEVELLPALKAHINDVFAIFSIKKCNSDEAAGNNGKILDPADKKIIINNNDTFVKVVAREGCTFGRYRDNKVYFSEKTVSRSGFYVTFKDEEKGPHISSFEPNNYREILPDGSEKEFDNGEDHPIYTGFKFTDGSYEFCVLNFCNGFDYFGKKAGAEIARGEPLIHTAEDDKNKTDDDNYEDGDCLLVEE